jgi:hypothetical protein
MIGPWWNRVLPYWRHPISSPTEAMIRNELWETLQEFLSPLVGDAASQGWGWKLPPTVFFTPFLQRIWPDLRCVHLTRDGRDMAFSTNQNQLGYLGPVALEADELILPSAQRSIRLWDRLNTRLAEYAERHLGGRYLQLRFEDLCAEPVATIARLLSFLEIEGDARRLAKHVSPPASLGRWRQEPAELVERLTDLARTGLDRFGYRSSFPPDASCLPQPVLHKPGFPRGSAYPKAS